MDTKTVFWQSAIDQSVVDCAGPMSADWIRLSTVEGKRLHRAQCVEKLRSILQPGSTVYTVLRHTSSSGMTRHIDLFRILDNTPRCITWLASHALNDRLHNGGGIIVNGCGMDMGFHLVYNLGATLWPNGTDKPHGTRNGAPDSSGGYALNHEWI